MHEQANNRPATERPSMYFDAQHLGAPSDCYVCWIDVMGSKNHMSQSIKTSANFVFKLHCALLMGVDGVDVDQRDNISVYPVMDGAFVTCESRSALDAMLGHTMRALARNFLQESQNRHRFVVRGATAYGRVYHGKNLAAEASRTLHANQRIRNSILLGLPMVLAFEEERAAPPFGIAIERSARSMSPAETEPYQFTWWKWYRSAGAGVDLSQLRDQIDQFFQWHIARYLESQYNKDAIEHHREMARQYFLTQT